MKTAARLCIICSRQLVEKPLFTSTYWECAVCDAPAKPKPPEEPSVQWDEMPLSGRRGRTPLSTSLERFDGYAD